MARSMRMGQVRAVHLWYSPPEAPHVADEMARELGILSAAMNADGVAFRSLTYQELFVRLRAHAAGLPDAAAYLEYLGDRYFGGGAR